MSSDGERGCFIAVFFLIAVIVSIGVSVSLSVDTERKKWQDELTQRGVCEWYADPKTGEKELKWKCGEVPHEQAD